MKTKSTRLPYFDYSCNGYYFVTIASHLRQPVLISKKAAIESALNSLSKESASLDYHVLMPDHIHMIVILENSNFTLSEIVRRFKSRSSKEAGVRLWQPNYYEHVIRNEKALEKIREYIQNNPEATELKIEEFYKNKSAR